MKGKIIGIDPGLTATGIVLAYPKKRRLTIYRHSVIGAEGDNWYEKCDNVVFRMAQWIILNTNHLDPLYVMIEEPINMLQSRAWSAALQNRLLSLIVDKLTNLDHRTVRISIINPLTMKRIFTGSGKASKDQVMEVASGFYRFRNHHTKRIREAIADAIGIAYCCWIYNRAGEDIVETKGITRL